MVDIIKQDMTDIWAVAGDVTAPDPSKVRSGWGVEVVPRQWWNWMQYRSDTNVAYMLQKGIPEWDQFTEYLSNKSYVQRNGIIYKCILTGVDKDPATTPANWVKAFVESSAYLEKIKGLPVVARNISYIDATLTAVNTFLGTTGHSLLGTDTPLAARNVLSAQLANTNLTALSGATAAVNTFPYFTSTTAMSTAAITALGRSLVAAIDAAAARVVLGLGTAATSDVTTTSVDTTAGRLTKVGDFGIGATGADVPSVTTFLAHNPTGLYRSTSAMPGSPTLPGGGIGGLQVIVTGYPSNTFYFVTDAVGNTYSAIWNGTVISEWVRGWTTSTLKLTTSSTDATTGSVLRVGDFGVGAESFATSVVNADTITATGDYRVGSSWGGSPFAGVNANNQGGLRHTATFIDTNYCQQDFTSLSGNIVVTKMTRRKVNGTWQPWVEDLHTGNPDVAASALGLNASATAPVTGTGSSVMSNSPALTGAPTAPTAVVGSNNTQLATTAFVQQNASAVPAGTVVAYAGATLPAGWHRCNGAIVSRVTYPELFTAIGTIYGIGNGSTTFGLPELRGEFVRGWDNGRGVDSNRGLGVWQDSQFQSHTHTFAGTAYAGHTHTGTTATSTHSHTVSGTTNSAGSHTHTTQSKTEWGQQGGAVAYAAGSNSVLIPTSAAGDHTHTISGSTSGETHSHTFTTAAGGAFTPAGTISAAGAGSETRPRNMAMLYIIKY